MNDEERQRLLDAILDRPSDKVIVGGPWSPVESSAAPSPAMNTRLPAAGARRLPGGQHRTSCTPSGRYGALAHPMTCPDSVLEERDQLLSDGFGVSQRAEMSSASDVDDAGMIERFVDTAQCVFEVTT